MSMSDKASIEDNAESRPLVTSVKELKASLMRRAFDGQSKHTPAQMMLLIQWRLSANNITEQDRAVLDDVNSFNLSDPPRSVLMLDALAREAEKAQIAEHGKVVNRVRYEYNPATVPPHRSLQ